MRALIALSVLIIAGVFGLVLVLGLFGVVDLQYLYIDVTGVAQGIRYDTYVSNRNNFQIKYPESWSIIERLDRGRVELARQNEDGVTTAGVYIRVSSIEEDTNFLQFVEDKINASEELEPDFEQEDLREVTIAENSGFLLTYTTTAREGLYRRRLFLFANSGKYYEITTEADTTLEDYESVESTIERMLESLRILDTIRP